MSELERFNAWMRSTGRIEADYSYNKDYRMIAAAMWDAWQGSASSPRTEFICERCSLRQNLPTTSEPAF